jgi:hypothetical protein
MAEVAAVRIHDIQSFSHGTSQYIGIKSADILVNSPEIAFARKDGDTYPTVAQVTHTDQSPVMIRITTQDSASFLALLAAAAASLVIVGKTGATTKTFTLSNAIFRRPQARVGTAPGQFGETTLEAVSVSSDGTTLPLAIT